MRLLIYLIALFCGFSAAEAARAEVAPASSVAQTAVAVAEARAVNVQPNVYIPQGSRAPIAAAILTIAEPLALTACTPISLHDLSRQ